MNEYNISIIAIQETKHRGNLKKLIKENIYFAIVNRATSGSELNS